MLLCIASLAGVSPLIGAGAQARPQQAPASRAPGDTLLTASALRADIAILREALEALHPGLYRYNTPAQLSNRFAALDRSLGDGATVTAAYLELTRFTAALRCGHTFPNPANQSRGVAGAVFGNTPRVPFYFRWIDRRIVVTQDASAGGTFPRGTQVLAVNGVPAATILARLLPLSRADGGTDTKRVAGLGLLPGERWQAFDVLYPHVFSPPPGEWTFLVRRPGEGERVVRASPSTAAQRTATMDSTRAAQRSAGAPPWRLDAGGDGIATMTMPTWVTFNDTWDWQGWVDRAFDTLAVRRSTALVVDLRGNEGGTSVGNAILAHLVPADAPLEQFTRYTRYRRIPGSLRPYLDTWDRSFDDWGDKATIAPDRPGFYRMRRFDDDTAGTLVRARTPRFTGRVFVLVDGDNSSATFEFALAVRQRKLGMLVGEPTGGNQRGINGGAFYFLRLPNSGIEIDLPLIAFFPREQQADGGLTPDVIVPVRAQDITTGTDRAMERVRALMRTAR